MAPTSTPPLPAPVATSTAQAVGAFLAAATVSNRDVGIGTLLGGGDTEYSESAAVSVHSSNSSSSRPVAGAGATLFLDGSATAIGAEAPAGAAS